MKYHFIVSRQGFGRGVYSHSKSHFTSVLESKHQSMVLNCLSDENEPDSESNTTNTETYNRGSQELTQHVIDKHLPKASYPSLGDIQVIEQRQLGHKVTNIFAVTKTKCQYGFPQAYVQLPIGHNNLYSSGMIRLSCPHLVKAIDKFEIAGKGIEYFNNILQSNIGLKSKSSLSQFNKTEVIDLGHELRSNFLSTNKAWQDLRVDSITDAERAEIQSHLGVEGGNKLLNAGIIGVTPNKVDDVKCLHAHVADYLIRGNNKIGEMTLTVLENREEYEYNNQNVRYSIK